MGEGGLREGGGNEKTCRGKMQDFGRKARKCVADFDPSAFRAQMREKHLARGTESDLFKAQKSCRELDEKKEFSEPAEKWFWPAVEKVKTIDETEDEEGEEEEEEEDIFTSTEKLGLLVTYLRTEHVYCIYCGINFYNEKDMSDTCP